MERYVWSQRSRVYLVGVAILILATVLYTIGHVAPYWVRADPALNIGIWFLCPDNGSCFEHSFSSDADYLKATRILQVLGLAGLVGAIGISIFQNCRRVHPGTSYILEAVIAVSAILGFSGAMVYVGFSRENIEMFPDLRYDFAFALNVAACILALIAALFIFCPKICCNDDDNDGKNDTDARSLQSSRQQGSSYLEGGKWDREGTLQRRFSGYGGPVPWPYAGFYRNGGPYWKSSGPYWKSSGPYLNGGGFQDGRPVDWSGPSSLLSGPYTTYYGVGQYVPTPSSRRPSLAAPQPPLEDYHSDHDRDHDEPSRYVINPLAPRPGLVQVLPRTPHPSNLPAFRREVIELQPSASKPAEPLAFSHRRMRHTSGGSDAAGNAGVDPAGRYEGRGGLPRVSLDSLPPLEILVPSSAPQPPPMMELSPFRLPRVVVRGNYDPATGGYPQYMMM